MFQFPNAQGGEQQTLCPSQCADRWEVSWFVGTSGIFARSAATGFLGIDNPTGPTHRGVADIAHIIARKHLLGQGVYGRETEPGT